MTSPRRRTAGAPRRVVDRDDRDRGSLSPFVLGLVVALMVVAGLVVDGGRAVNARAGAMDAAEQAARAGAAQLDLDALRTTGDVRLDEPAARSAALRFLTDAGYSAATATVSTAGNAVTVEVRAELSTSMLSLILIRTIPVDGHALARPAVGIDTEFAFPGGP